MIISGPYLRGLGGPRPPGSLKGCQKEEKMKGKEEKKEKKRERKGKERRGKDSKVNQHAKRGAI